MSELFTVTDFYHAEHNAMGKISKIASGVFSNKLNIRIAIYENYWIGVTISYDGASVMTKFLIRSTPDAPDDMIKSKLEEMTRELGRIFFSR